MGEFAILYSKSSRMWRRRRLWAVLEVVLYAGSLATFYFFVSSEESYTPGSEEKPPEWNVYPMTFAAFTPVLFTFFRFVTNLSQEKRMLAILRKMGMSMVKYFSSWYLFNFLFSTGILLVLTIPLHFAVFSRTSFFFIFFLFWLTALTYQSLTYLVAALFRRTKSCLLAAITLVAIPELTCYFLEEQSRSFTNFFLFSFTPIFSSTKLLKAMLVFQKKEIDWGIGDLTSDVREIVKNNSENPLGDDLADLEGVSFLGFMAPQFFSFIFLYFLSILLWNFFSNEFGKHRSIMSVICSGFEDDEKGFSSKKGKKDNDLEETLLGDADSMDNNFGQDRIKLQKQISKTVTFKDVSKKFSNTLALDNLNLSLIPNQIFVVLGLNGSGKSTFLDLLNGVIQPSSGEIDFFGENTAKWNSKDRKRFGFVPENICFYPNMTVKEHLELFYYIKKTYEDKKERKEANKAYKENERKRAQTKKNLDPEKQGSGISGLMRSILLPFIATLSLTPRQIKLLLGDFDLLGSEKKKCLTLTALEKQKLALCLAFIGDPSVVLLDQPTSGMDLRTKRYIWNSLQKYKKDRLVVCTSHSSVEAENLGDRVGILNQQGQIIACGASYYLKKTLNVGYELRLERFNSEARDSVLEALVKKYIPQAELFTKNSTNAESPFAYFRLPETSTKLFPGLFSFLELTPPGISMVQSHVLQTITVEDMLVDRGKFKTDLGPIKETDAQNINESDSKTSRKGGSFGNTFAIFGKRFAQARRGFSFLLLQFFLPVFIIIVSSLGTKLLNEKDTPSTDASDQPSEKESSLLYPFALILALTIFGVGSSIHPGKEVERGVLRGLKISGLSGGAYYTGNIIFDWLVYLLFIGGACSGAFFILMPPISKDYTSLAITGIFGFFSGPPHILYAYFFYQLLSTNRTRNQRHSHSSNTTPSSSPSSNTTPSLPSSSPRLFLFLLPFSLLCLSLSLFIVSLSESTLASVLALLPYLFQIVCPPLSLALFIHRAMTKTVEVSVEGVWSLPACLLGTILYAGLLYFDGNMRRKEDRKRVSKERAKKSDRESGGDVTQSREIGDQGGAKSSDGYPVTVNSLSIHFKADKPGCIKKKYFTYRESVLALDKISFVVGKGGCLAVLGTQSSGLTTLGEVLLSELSVSEGKVEILSLDHLKKLSKLRGRVGYCPPISSSFLIEHYNVKEHLFLFAKIKGVKNKQKKEEIPFLMKTFDLNDVAKKKVAKLNAGERRNLSICLALIGNPEVVVIDEPSAKFEPAARQTMLTGLRAYRLKHKSTTMVVLTHDPEEAQYLGTKMAILSEGRIQAIGETLKIQERFSEGFEVEVKLEMPNEREWEEYRNEVAGFGERVSNEKEAILMLKSGGFPNPEQEFTPSGLCAFLKAQVRKNHVVRQRR